MNRFLKMFCFFAWGSLLAVPLLQADTQTWVGGGGEDPQAFGDPLNWSPGAPLDATDLLWIATPESGQFPIISTGPNGQYPTTDNAIAAMDIGLGAADGRLQQDSGNITVTGDTRVGSTTSGSTLALGGGAFNQTGGDLVVGYEGKIGTLELSNTAALTMHGDANVWVGRGGGDGSVGTVSIAGTASFTTSSNLWIGASQTGYLNMDGGTLTSGAWLVIGANGYGGEGTNGYGSAIIDGGAQINMTGTGNGLVVGEAANGTLTMYDGEIDVYDWMAIGRHGGDGQVTMYGTSKIVHNGLDNFLVGDDGTGTLVLGAPGGSDNPTFSNQTGAIIVRNSTITVNSGSVDANSSDVSASLKVFSSGSVIMNGGSLTSGANVAIGDGTLELNGGTCETPGITTASSTVINFNGGMLKASSNNADFIAGTTPTLNVLKNTTTNLGAVIDTNGKNIAINQSLVTGVTGDTDGGLTKQGTGNLTLSAVSSYTGPTTIDDGTVQLKTTLLTAHQEASTDPNAMGTRFDGPYALGRNFTANASIQVTQLGVFDSEGDGLYASHVVHLTNTDDMSDTTVSFTPEAPGTYQDGYRFITLDTPLSLNAAGHYLVWVDTIGGADIFGDADSGMSVSYDTGSNSIILGNPVWSPEGNIPVSWWSTAVNGDAAATFIYYNPSGVITADLLPTTTPVVMGGPTGSTPTLDLQGADQQIASLADVDGAEVSGVVTNSDTETPVVLTLGATSGTTTYSGSIDGAISLVKNGDSTQNLVGSLTYTGDTTVSAGTLNVSGIDTPDSTVTVTGDGVLTASSITAATLTIGGTRASAPAPVPEPGTIILLAFAGLGALAAARRRRK